MKRILHGFGVLGAVLGLLMTADLVISGSFEDSVTRTYILPNLANYATANLPSTTQIAGRMAYDSTLKVPTSDDGTGWRPIVTRYFARFQSKLEVNQTAVPTLTSCTGGSMSSGSTDTSGEIVGITGTSCTLNFNSNYVNTPFGTIAKSSITGGNNALRYKVFKTGIDVYGGLSGGGDAVSYVVIGTY